MKSLHSASSSNIHLCSLCKRTAPGFTCKLLLRRTRGDSPRSTSPHCSKTGVRCKLHGPERQDGIALPSLSRSRVHAAPWQQRQFVGHRASVGAQRAPSEPVAVLHITSRLLLPFHPSHNLYTGFYRCGSPCSWGLFKTGGECVCVCFQVVPLCAAEAV